MKDLLSRRTRYRVWGVKENKYYPVLNWCFDGKPTITMQYNPVKKLTGVTPERMVYSKDMKSVPIFEGDIVKFDHYDNMEYDEDDNLIFTDTAQFSSVGEDGEVSGDFGDWGNWLIRYAREADYFFEVIGTVKENPEMVKEYKLKGRGFNDKRMDK